jgi:hypothetical protein
MLEEWLKWYRADLPSLRHWVQTQAPPKTKQSLWICYGHRSCLLANEVSSSSNEVTIHSDSKDCLLPPQDCRHETPAVRTVLPPRWLLLPGEPDCKSFLVRPTDQCLRSLGTSWALGNTQWHRTALRRQELSVGILFGNLKMPFTVLRSPRSPGGDGGGKKSSKYWCESTLYPWRPMCLGYSANTDIFHLLPLFLLHVTIWHHSYYVLSKKI